MVTNNREEDLSTYDDRKPQVDKKSAVAVEANVALSAGHDGSNTEEDPTAQAITRHAASIVTPIISSTPHQEEIINGEDLSNHGDKMPLVDKTGAVRVEAGISILDKAEKENVAHTTSGDDGFNKAMFSLASCEDPTSQALVVFKHASSATSTVLKCSDDKTNRSMQPTSSVAEPDGATDTSCTVCSNKTLAPSDDGDDNDDEYSLDDPFSEPDVVAIMTSDIEDGTLFDNFNRIEDELDVNAVVRVNCNELRQLVHCTADDDFFFLLYRWHGFAVA